MPLLLLGSILVSCGKQPVLITHGAVIEKIDDEWSKVNRVWLQQRYQEERLLLKALDQCRAMK